MKRFKKISKVLIAASLITISAFALLKTGVLGKEKNTLIVDPNARYDIVADLDGGKFEPGSKPEFVKMDNGKWLYKYKPTVSPTKIPKPVKDGYTFEGWLVGNNQTPKPEYSIPAWNKKNISLTAKYKVADSILLSGKEFNKAITSMPEFKNVTEVNFIKSALDTDGIDLSAVQDKSIIGSISDNVLNIKCAGNIYANKDCSKMFEFLFRLVNINFNNFNTSEVTNMNRMFYSCYRLSKLDIADFDTSNVTDMSEMFYNCAEVLDFNLNKFDTSNVTNMNNMFRYCYKLNSPNLKSFNTSNVENMSYMFSGCTNLTNLDITNFNTSKVTDMSMMFGDTKLIELDISNFNTANVTNMDGMFYNIKQLTKLDISNFDTSNVTNMSGMFSLCESLGELDVSKFNTSKVKDMSRMFNSCRKIDVLDVSNFDTTNVTSMSGMFDGCTLLKSLNLNKFTFSKTVETEDMFRSCINLSSEIIISNVNVLNYTRMFQRCSRAANAEFWVKYTSPETKLLAQKMVNTKTDGDHVYLREPSSTLERGISFNRRVMGINGFNNVTEIRFVKGNPNPGGTDLSDKQDKSIIGSIENNILTIACAGEIYANPDSSFMFSNFGDINQVSGNKVLNKITFENFNTSKVTNMESMFGNCYNLKQINLSEFNTGNVENMRSMFSGCKKLEMLDVSNFNTSKVKNMSYMFAVNAPAKDMNENYLASSLSEIIGLDKLDTSNVIDMSSMFSGCHSLVSLNVSNFNTSNVTDMSGMFKECSKLESIDVSNFNTSKVTNMSEMFSTGRLTTDFTIDGSHNPNDIESNLKSIAGLNNLDMSKVTNTSKMFEDNISLSGEITVDNFVVTDYTDMFIGCSQSPSTEFWVKWKTPEDKELARKIVETKNPSDHVYLWEPSSTLVDGGTFNSELYTIKDKIQHIKFVVGHPNQDGIDLSEKHNKSITGVLNGDTLTISCAGTMYANPYSSYMFDHSTYLVDIDFSNFDTSRVIETVDMFSGCLRLESMKGIENWDVSNITNMESMFTNCQKLKTLNLSKWKTGKLTNINYMFQRCYELENLDLKGFDVSGLRFCNFVFMYCTKLKYVDIAGWDTQNITHMRDTFAYCSVLQEINGLESIDTTNCHFYDHTFLGCEKLCGEITIKNEAGLIIIGSGEQFTVSRVFENASTDINSRFVVKYINEKSRRNAAQLVGSKSKNSNVFLYNEPCTLIDGPTFNSIVINKEYSTIKNIVFEQDVPHNMSKYPYKDLSVAKDKSIVAYIDGDTLKVASDGKIMANEFCTEMFAMHEPKEIALNSISFDNFDTSNTIDLSSTFFNCSVRKIVGIEKWDTSKVVAFDGIFEGSKNLQSVDLNNWDMTSVKYGLPSFSRSSLGEIDVTGWKFNDHTDFTHLFSNASNLENIIGLNTWDVSNATNFQSMFFRCVKLKTIDIRGWDTSNVKIIDSMFYDCCSLETIVGLENINTDNIGNYWSAFLGCSQLTATLTIKKVVPFAHLFGPYVTFALDNCSTEPNSLFTIQYIDAGTKDVAESFIHMANNDKEIHVELKYIGEGPEPINTKEETKQNTLNTFKPAFNPNKSTTPKPVKLTLINGPSAQYTKQVIQITNNKIPNLNAPDLNPLYAGQFGGYYYDEQFTKPVKQGDIITRDLIVYARW